MAEEELRLRIEDLVVDRTRVLAPAMLVSFVFFVAASGPLGYRTTGSYIYGWSMAAAMAVLTWAFVARCIPRRLRHVAAVALMWCHVSFTLVALHLTHEPGLFLMLMFQIASAGILLHTRLVVTSLVAVFALAVPPALSATAFTPAIAVVALVSATLFGIMIHTIVRRSVESAERSRLAEAATSRQLAQELAEIAKLQEQLLHAQRMEAVGTLAAGVAHDMNNVLASITNLATLVQGVTCTEVADDLAQILAQAERGGQLTRGLLAFSRRGQYRKQVVRFDTVMRDVLPLLARTLPKSIAVVDQLTTGDARVEGDAVQLTQVVVNFALNAAEAIDGAGTLTLASDVVERGTPPRRYVRLRVTDTGRGMDAATRLRVFEPFFTTKQLGKGTGLGLAIVWGIVEAHDGTVEVHSEPGKGATFTVYVPITDRTPSLEPVQRPAPVVATVERGTVLVVDDEDGVRESTRRLLVRMGLDALVASNGEEALRVFRANTDRIGLVILDMAMPVMGGAECFRALRAASDVPVLIATGYAADEDVRELYALGACVLEKPYLPAALRSEVARLLRAPPARARAAYDDSLSLSVANDMSSTSVASR